MLAEFKCWTRNCKHYDGVKWFGDDERSVCKAFPAGIPPEIAYGDNLHLEPIKGQQNDIVFESEEEPVK